MTTRIEFYQRLREHIPDAAARLIAEETKVEGEVPSKADLSLTEERLGARIVVTEERFDARLALTEQRLLTSIEQLRSSMFRWQLMFFVPLWIGVYGTLVAILVRG
ncbi:MAG: hypothetical protein ACRD3V_32345 [Vicinamibacteria bacterium]